MTTSAERWKKWYENHPDAPNCAQRSKKWRETNFEEYTEYHRKWRASHKQSVIDASKRYRARHPERVKEQTQKRTQRKHELKSEIYKLLGGKCAKCGFTDVRALQIDHVKAIGNASKRKRKRGTYYNGYLLILEEIKKGNHNYQLLCANCNWIKRWENNEQDSRQKFITVDEK